MIELGLELLRSVDSLLKPLTLLESVLSFDTSFASRPPKVADRWCNSMWSLGSSGMSATDSRSATEVGRDRRRNGDIPRLRAAESMDPVDVLSGVSRHKGVGRASIGTSGVDSPSEMAIDEGRERRRKGERCRFRDAVCSRDMEESCAGECDEVDGVAAAAYGVTYI